MRLLIIVSLFALVLVINCQTYDELARDECFKKVYLCGDYRGSVTGGAGRLATEPHRFSEICRKHKEFIACVEMAADFCSGKLTNVSRMVLDNRRSLKLFCTDLEWKRNYFSSAKCINENEKAIVDECIKEEEEYKDDRPYWCLIPEPCEALERVFACTVRKMKKLCGSIAAEVYRRIHILKMENRDIVCEIRQRNPMYCRYRHQKPSQTESIKRIGSLSAALSEAINNIFETALVDTMDNFALLLNEENISNLLDSEEYKLRKSIFKAEVEEKFSPFFKKCKLPEGELSQLPDLSTKGFSLLFGNIKRILLEATSQSSKFGSTFYENILKSCGTEKVVLASCLGKLKELEVLKSLNPVSRISKELNAELKSLKDYIIGIFELLNCNEDFLVNSISQDTAFITWDNMNSFPVQTLSCGWKNESFKKLFQCSFKLKTTYPTPKDVLPDIQEHTIAETTIKRENVNDFMKPFIVESSIFTDSGSGMVEDFMVSTNEREIKPDYSVTDLDSEVGEHDIHRSGQQVAFQEEKDSGEVLDQDSEDIKVKSFMDSTQNANELHTKGETEEQSMEETTYILVDPPYLPTDSVSYLAVDTTSYTVKSYLESLESSNSPADSQASESKTEVNTKKTNLERENFKLQLRKIVSVLNDRFASGEEKVFKPEEDSKLNPVKRQKLENLHFQSYQPYSGNINRSSQTDLHDLLKAKLNEYSELYSLYSKLPTDTKGKMRGVRTKRLALNERQNSKMSKSFNVKSSNESVRTNSRFINFKAEL